MFSKNFHKSILVTLHKIVSLPQFVLSYKILPEGLKRLNFFEFSPVFLIGIFLSFGTKLNLGNVYTLKITLILK